MQQLTNFGNTALNGAINNSQTTIVVVDAATFPLSGEFTILIESELINVTGVSGNTLTVVRGQEGTTAAAHTDATAVKLVLSKGVLENFFSERFAVGGYASRPTGIRAGQRYFANDVDLGWEFDGTNWNLTHPLFVPYSHRVDLSGWTANNLGSSVWTDLNGVLDIAMPGASADSWRFYHHNVPTAPFTLNAIWRVPCLGPQYSTPGTGFYDGTKLFCLTQFADNSNYAMGADTYNNATSWNSNRYRQVHYQPPWYWTRVRDDGSTWYFEFSTDGAHYNLYYSVTRNDWLTPTKVFLGANRTENTFDTLHVQCLAYWEG